MEWSVPGKVMFSREDTIPETTGQHTAFQLKAKTTAREGEGQGEKNLEENLKTESMCMRR